MDLREIGGPAQRRHPWETARADFFCERAVAHSTGPLRVLDIGAGDGFLGQVLLSRLPSGSQCVCVDPHYTDAHLQRFVRPELPALSFARNAPQGPFDLLLMLDVLEHVEDDHALLTDCATRLSKGGLLLASVPAFMALYSAHDVLLGHHRRYRLQALRALARRAGFEVLEAGGLFHGLLAVRGLQKAGELLRGRRARPGEPGFGAAETEGTELSEWRGGAALTWLVNRALSADNAVSRAGSAAGLSLPGLSAWLLGRKP